MESYRYNFNGTERYGKLIQNDHALMQIYSKQDPIHSNKYHQIGSFNNGNLTFTSQCDGEINQPLQLSQKEQLQSPSQTQQHQTFQQQCSISNAMENVEDTPRLEACARLYMAEDAVEHGQNQDQVQVHQIRNFNQEVSQYKMQSRTKNHTINNNNNIPMPIIQRQLSFTPTPTPYERRGELYKNIVDNNGNTECLKTKAFALQEDNENGNKSPFKPNYFDYSNMNKNRELPSLPLQQLQLNSNGGAFASTQTKCREVQIENRLTPLQKLKQKKKEECSSKVVRWDHNQNSHNANFILNGSQNIKGNSTFNKENTSFLDRQQYQKIQMQALYDQNKEPPQIQQEAEDNSFDLSRLNCCLSKIQDQISQQQSQIQRLTQLKQKQSSFSLFQTAAEIQHHPNYSIHQSRNALSRFASHQRSRSNFNATANPITNTEKSSCTKMLRSVESNFQLIIKELENQTSVLQQHQQAAINNIVQQPLLHLKSQAIQGIQPLQTTQGIQPLQATKCIQPIQTTQDIQPQQVTQGMLPLQATQGIQPYYLRNKAQLSSVQQNQQNKADLPKKADLYKMINRSKMERQRSRKQEHSSGSSYLGVENNSSLNVAKVLELDNDNSSDNSLHSLFGLNNINLNIKIQPPTSNLQYSYASSSSQTNPQKIIDQQVQQIEDLLLKYDPQYKPSLSNDYSESEDDTQRRLHSDSLTPLQMQQNQLDTQRVSSPLGLSVQKQGLFITPSISKYDAMSSKSFVQVMEIIADSKKRVNQTLKQQNGGKLKLKFNKMEKEHQSYKPWDSIQSESVNSEQRGRLFQRVGSNSKEVSSCNVLTNGKGAKEVQLGYANNIGYSDNMPMLSSYK